jgi:hypothetical protein
VQLLVCYYHRKLSSGQLTEGALYVTVDHSNEYCSDATVHLFALAVHCVQQDLLGSSSKWTAVVASTA